MRLLPLSNLGSEKITSSNHQDLYPVCANWRGHHADSKLVAATCAMRVFCESRGNTREAFLRVGRELILAIVSAPLRCNFLKLGTKCWTSMQARRVRSF
jgi:hypothetical protein